jgi:acyl-CoA synthetase (AMP-forming)/AMP-acid ligase II/acyl carrier protein
MTGFPTLTATLDARQRDDRRITYLDGEGGRREVTFGQLRQRAIGVLHHLQQFGLAPGDEVILYTSSNEQFLDGFWACLYGGFVPVPVAVGISDDSRRKLLQIFRQLVRPGVYTEAAQLKRLRDFASKTGCEPEIEALVRRSLVVEQVTDISVPGKLCDREPGDIAFIQFSSGSTSEPKGVVLTHANVTANIAAIIDGGRFTDRDVSLSWMPLTHDMGLIGFHLAMLSAGISHTIMDTRLFSRRPLLWLKEASTAGATLLSSPNFGYKHFLKVYDAKGCDGLDLRRVRLIFNGAEPISAELCERFLLALAPHGLAREAMYPVYGLAEASLAVTFPEPGSGARTVVVDRHGLATGEAVQPARRGDRDALELMIVGRPVQGCELRITDDSGGTVAAECVGHIEIRGTNVSAGYHGRPRAGSLAAGGWLDTGDLGFLREGELVVTGRHKEIMFVNGQNYYPQDIEALAASVPGVELGKVAAAGSLPAGADEDELLLFLLHRGSSGEFDALADALRRHIGEETGLQVTHVIPVRAIPKTTSGKLQRGRLAAAYEDGEFAEALAAEAARRPAPVAAEQSASEIEALVHDICAGVVSDRQVGADDNLFDLGISSLALAQIHERINERFPGQLDIEDLFQLPSVRAIAAHLARC